MREVVVNTHHLPRTVRARRRRAAAAFGLRVTSRTSGRSWARAAGRARLRRFFGDEPFLLVNGDVFFDFDLRRAGRARSARTGRRGDAGAACRNPDPRRYGRVVTATARPHPRRSRAGRGRRAGARWLFTGIHVLDPALLERLPAGPSETVRDLYAAAARGGRARRRACALRGAWYDLGRPPLYLASQLAMLRKRVGRTAAARSSIRARDVDRRRAAWRAA